MVNAPRTLRTKLRRDVSRQWPQFTAVTVTILLGVTLFAATYDAYRNLDASYQQVFVDQRFADLFVTGGDTAAIAAAARATDGVGAVTTRVQADVPIRIGPDKLRGRIVGIPSGTQPVVNQLDVRGGHYPSAPGALAEKHIADHFELATGDRVEVLGPDGWRTVDVAGTAVSGEYLWPARSRQEIITLPDDFGVLFVTGDLAAQLAGHGPNQVVLRTGDGADRGAVLAELHRRAVDLGATEVLTRAEQPSNALLREDVDGFSQMSVAFPLLFLGAAAMATYVLLARRVRSERDVIGMLLASGLRRRHLLGHYLGFGMAAGTIGGVVGIGIGLTVARTLSRFYVGFIGLPADRAVIAFRPETVAIGVGFGIVTGIVAALAPALLASRTPPAEAMRAVVPTSGGGPSLLERLVPPLRRLPARWHLVLRGIGRNRRRTTYTVIGVMMSLLLILVSWTLIDTMNHLMAVQFDDVQRQDARVDFVTPVSREVLSDLAAVDGVRDVEPAVTVPVGLRAIDETYGTVLFALPQETDMHGFRLVDGRFTDLPADGLLVGQAVRDLLGVEVGDDIQVTIEQTGANSTVEIAGFLDEPLGTFAYLSLDRIERLAGGEVPLTTALVRFDPAADRDTVRRAIMDLEVVAAYEDAQALQRVFADFTGLFYAFIGGTLVLGGLMAFAMIFTTMSVNIIERAREVATLQASGVRTRTVSRLIATENLLVTALGIVPGLALGVLGGAAMLRTYSSDLFTLELVVRPRTLVASAAAIVVVAALSQIPSLRAIRRMDIASVVRERTT